ncbi:MAG: ABC transporter permease [Spirochaetales bacterium]|jgi:peptide/nickel transport system permease protein|nr:ABC transporter permease [Spirochaetales bacterium]
MQILRRLLVKGLTMLAVLLVVQFLVVITLGATGYSDRMLDAVISEQLRAIRPSLAETIRDPDRLEEALTAQKVDLEMLYGLDRPWFTRLPGMVFRVFSLDLGEAHTLRSSSGSNRVSEIVLERIPKSMLLLTTSMVITAAVGLLVGARLSSRAGTRLDRTISSLSAVSYAFPTWWVGILMILFFSFRLGILPSGGMYSAPPPEGGFLRFLDLLYHALLPVFTLVLAGIGPYVYVVRTIAINIAQSDHVTVARAKGLSDGLVSRRHILRVAAPPIVTGLIMGFAGTLGGSILVETVFNWQGMGRLYYEAIAGTPDEMVIVALTFVYTLLYVAARMILEVLYIFLDPRVRYG